MNKFIKIVQDNQEDKVIKLVTMESDQVDHDGSVDQEEKVIKFIKSIKGITYRTVVVKKPYNNAASFHLLTNDNLFDEN